MARFYFTEICLGMQHLHQHFVVYRDIKPENIFLDHEGHAKIGDFGLVKPDMNINEFTYSFCGSAEYMPPEMLLKCGHSYPVDYYCLGALLYEVTLSILINSKLVTGLPPFYSLNNDEICERVLTEELMFPSHAFNLSVDLKHLIRGLLKKNPYERMGN